MIVSGRVVATSRNSPGLLDQLVAHVVERRFLRGRDDFLVGERGQRDRIPVYHPPPAIDEPFAIKIDKRPLDGASSNPHPS